MAVPTGAPPAVPTTTVSDVTTASTCMAVLVQAAAATARGAGHWATATAARAATTT